MWDWNKTFSLALPCREPPSLFNRPEHVDKYKSISSLKYRVNDVVVPQYVDDFESEARDDVLMIANISLEDIQVCYISSVFAVNYPIDS